MDNSQEFKASDTVQNYADITNFSNQVRFLVTVFAIYSKLLYLVNQL